MGSDDEVNAQDVSIGDARLFEVRGVEYASSDLTCSELLGRQCHDEVELVVLCDRRNEVRRSHPHSLEDLGAGHVITKRPHVEL